MAVMSAGVHASCAQRFPRGAVLFNNRKSVDIRAQSDCRGARARKKGERPRTAGKPIGMGDSRIIKRATNARAGRELLVAELGQGVQLTTQCDCARRLFCNEFLEAVAQFSGGLLHAGSDGSGNPPKQSLLPQLSESGRLSPCIHQRKRVTLMADESGELTHGDAENSSTAGHIETTGGHHIHRLAEQGGIVVILWINRQFLALSAQFPKFARLMSVTIGDRAHLASELESQSKNRHMTILRLAAPLGRVGLDLGRNMLDPDRGIDLVAILPAWSRNASGVDFALLQQHRVLERGGMRSLDSDGALVDVWGFVGHAILCILYHERR